MVARTARFYRLLLLTSQWPVSRHHVVRRASDVKHNGEHMHCSVRHAPSSFLLGSSGLCACGGARLNRSPHEFLNSPNLVRIHTGTRLPRTSASLQVPPYAQVGSPARRKAGWLLTRAFSVCPTREPVQGWFRQPVADTARTRGCGPRRRKSGGMAALTLTARHLSRQGFRRMAGRERRHHVRRRPTRGQLVPGRGNYYNPVPGQPAASVALDFPLVWLAGPGGQRAPRSRRKIWRWPGWSIWTSSQDSSATRRSICGAGLPPPASGGARQLVQARHRAA